MTAVFWTSCAAMLIAAVGFIVVPLKTGKSLFATPVAFAALVLPLVAVGLYALLGSPGSVTAAATIDKPVSTSPKNGATSASLGSVGSLVEGLEARLQLEPDDGGGWMLLARSYQHLGRQSDALKAYERAKALGESNLEFEASMFGPGIAAKLQTAESGPALRGRVALSPAAAEKVLPGDTVFIFAKESREHRMPVAALRKPATDLPIEFVLTEKEMMVPDQSLVDFQQLVVTAKISRSGNAADNSQGLEAWSEPVSPVDGGRIELLITPTTDAGDAGNE